MNFSKKAILIGGAVTIAGLLLAIFLISGLGTKGTSAGEIVLEPGKYDLGDVPYGGGIVQRDFTLKNQGEVKLEINSVETSCGCTEARLIYDEDRSAKFGMHPNNETWSETISPDEKATLRVFYDPAAHGPEGIGPFRRAVWIESSDPDQEKSEVTIQGNVTN